MQYHREAIIVNCQDPMLWYADRIGQRVVIERETPEYYWCREGGILNCLNIVYKQDVKLVGIKEE